MSHAMCRGQDLRQESGRCRNKDPSPMHDEAIGHALGGAGVPSFDLSLLGNDLWQGLRLAPEVLKELGVRP